MMLVARTAVVQAQQHGRHDMTHRSCSTMHCCSSRALQQLARLPARPHGVLARAQSASAITELPLPEWVVSNGGQVHPGVRVNNTPDQGFGLAASMDLAAGEKLISLPPSCQLTYDEQAGKADQQSAKLLALIDKIPQELWGGKLAVQLAVHRLQLPTSHFAPYIRALPPSVQGVPIFFGKAGIDSIHYPPVTEQVKKRCRWLYDFTQIIAKLRGTPEDPFSGDVVDLNGFGWAFACVTSRAFRVRGPSAPAAMLPLIDMANHSFDPNCEVLPVKDSRGTVALYARRKIAAGESLLLSYGPLSNDFLFMDYGFIVPGNPHDRVTLSWDLERLELAALQGAAKGADGKLIQRISASAPWKKRFLEQSRLSGPNANLEVNLGGPHLIEPRVLAALRVLLATSEAEIQGRSPARLADLTQPLSRVNETAVLRIVTGLALIALQEFPTNLEEDLALLNNKQGLSLMATESQAGTAPALPPDVQLAVQFRVGKKQLLTDVLQGLARRLKELKEDTSLPAVTAPAARQKGQKPGAATSKGFGSRD